MRPTSLLHALLWMLAGVLAADSRAQVSAYTFTQSVGPWQPIAGTGTPLGLVGLPPWLAIDDDAFVTQGEDIPMSEATTG
ncbi:MAG: hypothetical protein ACO1NQ_00760, partial [Flavobacteriales bacterium]